MSAAWVLFLIGWKPVMFALIVFAVATAWKSPGIGVIAWLLSAPTCLFVSGYPRVGVIGLLLLACNAGGVYALLRGHRFGAGMLWAPFGLLAFVLGVLFFRHPF
jgi:hypothetical protein